MLFQGNLAEKNVTQLLNVISLSQKNGMLTLFRRVKSNSSGGSAKQQVECIQLSFVQGKIWDAILNGEEINLITALHRNEKLTDRQVQIIRNHAAGKSDKALALWLINGNYVTRHDVVVSMKKYISDIVHYLISWREGAFRFDSDTVPGQHRIPVEMDLSELLSNSLETTQEIAQLTDYLPNLDVRIALTKDYRKRLQHVNISKEAWQVVAFVNSHMNLREIAARCNLTGIEIRQILYNLEQDGIIKVYASDNPKKNNRNDKSRPMSSGSALPR